MLEKRPRPIGHGPHGLRAGRENLLCQRAEIASAPGALVLESPAFEDGAPLPARFTADGEGLSPPLRWRGAPRETAGLLLILEDPDAPALEPLIHLLAFDLPPRLGGLAEGLFRSPKYDGLREAHGRSAFHQAAYLPPGPPQGHGLHHYVFELFALDQRLSFRSPPGRGDVLRAMAGRVIAMGSLTAVYERA